MRPISTASANAPARSCSSRQKDDRSEARHSMGLRSEAGGLTHSAVEISQCNGSTCAHSMVWSSAEGAQLPSFDSERPHPTRRKPLMRTWLRFALILSLGLPLALLNLAPAGAQTPQTTSPSAGPQTPASPHMEIVHHPNYDQTVFMPFVPAIKIKSGKILWLAGTTALPVYHDHPQ